MKFNKTQKSFKNRKSIIVNLHSYFPIFAARNEHQ